jgi:site-specific recombinase XerC
MTPIAPLITAFLREHMPVERGYSPNTCETYAHAFRLLFEFASARLEKRPSQLCIEHITAALVLDFPRTRRDGLILNATEVTSARQGVTAAASRMRRRRNEQGSPV